MEKKIYHQLPTLKPLKAQVCVLNISDALLKGYSNSGQPGMLTFIQITNSTLVMNTMTQKEEHKSIVIAAASLATMSVAHGLPMKAATGS